MALIRNDFLIKNPATRPYPKGSREWDHHIRALQDLDARQTFTPNWDVGFSSAPTGDLSYIDFGLYVLMWSNDNLLGTSNSTSMRINNIPSEIAPWGAVQSISSHFQDNTVSATARARFVASTLLHFDIYDGTVPSPWASSGWTASGTKGLTVGWTMLYPRGIS